MSTHQDRNTGEAVLRGMRCKCPSCGIGSTFNGYLEVNQSCKNCSEELHHHRADDAPPYFTILIVGHVAFCSPCGLRWPMCRRCGSIWLYGFPSHWLWLLAFFVLSRALWLACSGHYVWMALQQQAKHLASPPHVLIRGKECRRKI